MVVSVKVGNLQIKGLKLSLNNSNVQIFLSDLDIVLIPKAPEKEKKAEQEKEKKSSGKKKQEEEFGIINNIINRIIGNITVDVKRVCIRVLLGHFDENEAQRDIPTVLLRLDHLWLGKQDQCPATYINDLINKSQYPDKQIYLDKKCVKLSSFSLHLLQHFDLFTEENSASEGLVFPFSYPQHNHPSSLLFCSNFEQSLEEILRIDFEEKGKATTSFKIPNVELIASSFQVNQIVTNFLKILRDQKQNNAQNLLSTSQAFFNKDEIIPQNNPKKPLFGNLNKEKIISKLYQDESFKQQIQEYKTQLLQESNHTGDSQLYMSMNASGMQQISSKVEVSKITFSLSKLSASLLTTERQLYIDKAFDANTIYGKPKTSLVNFPLERKSFYQGSSFFNLELRGLNLTSQPRVVVKDKHTYNWNKVDTQLEDFALFYYTLKSNQGSTDVSQTSNQSLHQMSMSDGSLFESAQQSQQSHFSDSIQFPFKSSYQQATRLWQPQTPHEWYSTKRILKLSKPENQGFVFGASVLIYQKQGTSTFKVQAKINVAKLILTLNPEIIATILGSNILQKVDFETQSPVQSSKGKPKVEKKKSPPLLLEQVSLQLDNSLTFNFEGYPKDPENTYLTLIRKTAKNPTENLGYSFFPESKPMLQLIVDKKIKLVIKQTIEKNELFTAFGINLEKIELGFMGRNLAVVQEVKIQFQEGTKDQLQSQVIKEEDEELSEFQDQSNAQSFVSNTSRASFASEAPNIGNLGKLKVVEGNQIGSKYSKSNELQIESNASKTITIDIKITQVAFFLELNQLPTYLVNSKQLLKTIQLLLALLNLQKAQKAKLKQSLRIPQKQPEQLLDESSDLFMTCGDVHNFSRNKKEEESKGFQQDGQPRFSKEFNPTELQQEEIINNNLEKELILRVEIDDIQALVSYEEKIKNNAVQIPLIKLRTKILNIDLKIAKGIQIDLKLHNFFIADFTRSYTYFHKSLVNLQDPFKEQKGTSLERADTFDREIEALSDKVTFYQQSGLPEKHKGQDFVMKAKICLFESTQRKPKRALLDEILSLLTLQETSLQEIYDLLDRQNRVPLRPCVNLELRGIVFSLCLKSKLPFILAHQIQQLQPLLEPQNPKVKRKDPELKHIEQEPLSFNLTLSEIALDYSPLLNDKQFQQVYKIKEDGSVKVNEYFKTDLRVLLVLEDLNFEFDKQVKDIQLQITEISFYLLKNNDFSRCTNQLLLRQQGLLAREVVQNQLGFSKILYLSQIEATKFPKVKNISISHFNLNLAQDSFKSLLILGDTVKIEIFDLLPGLARQQKVNQKEQEEEKKAQEESQPEKLFQSYLEVEKQDFENLEERKYSELDKSEDYFSLDYKGNLQGGTYLQNFDCSYISVKQPKKVSTIHSFWPSNSEKAEKIMVKISKFEVQLFKGLDFDFDNQGLRDRIQIENQLRNKASQSQNSEQQKTLETDYISKNNLDLYKEISFTRKKKKGRSGKLQIQFVNSLVSYIQDDQGYKRIALSLERINGSENLNGQPRKLLDYPLSYKEQHFLELIFEIEKEGPNNLYSLIVRPRSVCIKLNDNLLSFLLQFFEIDLTKKKQIQPQKVQKKQVQNRDFIKSLEIGAFYVKVSYYSEKMNATNLIQGDLLQFLNIFNIRDLQIDVKKFQLKQRLTLIKALDHTLAFYKQDLMNNQKANCVSAIGPLRTMFIMSSALYAIIKKPYNHSQTVLGILQGFSDGGSEAYRKMSQELSYLFGRTKE